MADGPLTPTPRAAGAAPRLARSLSAAVLTALALALGLAGCGGHAATRADVVARANAVCFATDAAIRAVPSAGSGSDAQLARYFAKVAPLLAREATSLRALPRPQNGRATLNAFIAAQSRTASEYARLAGAAHAHEATGVQAALSALAGSPVVTLARRYGLRQCTGTTATIH